MADGRSQIGEVAERLGLSIRTIRHYDDEGLVVPSARSEGGFRLYSEEDIERLALIKRMKPLAFSLQEMGELLEAHDRLKGAPAGGPEFERALARVREFVGQTEEKIERLRTHVEWAEEFAETLRGEIEQHRGRAPARGGAAA